MTSTLSSYRPRAILKPLVLLIFGMGPAACASQPEVSHLCEPVGSKIEPPRAGSAVLHAVDRVPHHLPDGLPVSTLQTEGIDPKPIGEMLEAIRDGRYTKLDSLLIARNGKLVLEAYFNGFDRETKHDTRSAFKSVTSALAGIAIDHGLISNTDRAISEYFPTYWPHIRDDVARKNRISLTHLLTMTPGFDAGECCGLRPDREDEMSQSNDWIAYSLALPMVSEPGTRFSYNSSTTFLIGEVIARAAGEPLPKFAKKHLFKPLGITDYCWTLTPQRRAVAQGNFYVRPRDMLKIGLLFLDRGTWQGQRVVSTDWVDKSTRHHVDIPQHLPESQPHRDGYGYQWWTRSEPNSKFDHYFASGNGGQKIYVFPQIRMVAVFTGSHYNRAIGHQQPTQILNRYIAPAVLK